MEDNSSWAYSSECACPGVSLQSGSGKILGNTDFHSGVSNRGYKQRIALLQSATTSYARTTTTREPIAVNGLGYIEDVSTPRRWYPFTVKGSINNMLPDSSSIPYSSLVNKAQSTSLGKFYNNANGSVAGLVFAGELGETVKMLTHPGRSMVELTTKFYKSLRSARRTARPSTRDFGRALNDLYLEWTFGISPLIGDIRDTAKVLHKLSSETRVEHDRGRSTEEEVSLSPVFTNGAGAGNFTFNYQYQTVAKVKVDIGGGRAITAQSVSDVLSTDFGFNLHSVPRALYDLIPFSFCVDYVTNLGDLVSAVSGTSQKHFYSYQSTKIECKHKIISFGGRFSAPGYPVRQGYATIGGEARTVRFTRAPVSASGIIQGLALSFSLPSIKQGFNLASLVAARTAFVHSR
jgi:hypothetical protein